MTAFHSIPQYSPILVLGAGLFAFLGLWGVGTALLYFIRLRLPPPWNSVTAILIGIQALSLTVQFVGVVALASRIVLGTIWLGFVAIGVLVVLLHAPTRAALPRPKRYGAALLPIAIIAAAILVNALVALAPSTKIDELYYHMLVPSRIVSDSALRFYREPWLGAIGPQMVYQISAAPNHAIGYPDATNVISWALSATLLWFAWRIIRANANGVPWTALCVAILYVGIYPTVWHVTGGAHAMGDLALAAAVVAFCFRERWFADLPPPSYGAMFSILLLAAATSKVSLLPICGLLLCAGGWPLLKSSSPLVRRHVVLAVTLPWIVFYCPIVWWTWAHSGSPLGAILAGVFESPVYSDTWVQKTFQFERDTGQLPLNMIRNAAVGYSPLIWVGAIAAFFAPQIPKAQRAILAILLALQSALIYWLLPYDMRYLSLHYGLFIAFASSAPRSIQFRMESARAMLVACAIFLLPWLAVQSYYARQFFAVSTGLEKYAFYERYVAFYSDYVELDRLLSKDSVLLVPGFRLSAVYSPRPMFFDAPDLPPGRPAALFALAPAHSGASLNGYRIGDEIYENPHAVIRAYRTPGRAPVIGQLKIMQLIKD